MALVTAYTGLETSRTVSIGNGTMSFSFTKQQLEDILTNTDAKGVRFHFKRSGSTAGGVIAIGVQEDTAEIQDPQKESYIKSDNAGTLKKEDLPSWLNAADKMSNPTSSVGICAYFSKEVLSQNILNTALNPGDLIEVFIIDADISKNQSGTELARTLAINGPGNTSLPRLSELPCPPHCGSDYVGRGGN